MGVASVVPRSYERTGPPTYEPIRTTYADVRWRLGPSQRCANMAAAPSSVADLSRADHVLSDTYDCFINQFTMHVIFDVEAALYHSVRVLKPGGVLLINFSCVDYYFPRGLDMHTGAPLFVFWWFTPIQVENMLRRIGLTGSDYELALYGNLFARIAYQLNVSAEELTRCELEYVDPGHPLLICARVTKPVGWKATRPEYRDPWLPDTRPAHWNPDKGHYADADPA
jgi:SAM-dependent methyltransferase